MKKRESEPSSKDSKKDGKREYTKAERFGKSSGELRSKGNRKDYGEKSSSKSGFGEKSSYKKFNKSGGFENNSGSRPKFKPIDSDSRDRKSFRSDDSERSRGRRPYSDSSEGRFDREKRFDKGEDGFKKSPWDSKFRDSDSRDKKPFRSGDSERSRDRKPYSDSKEGRFDREKRFDRGEGRFRKSSFDNKFGDLDSRDKKPFRSDDSERSRGRKPYSDSNEGRFDREKRFDRGEDGFRKNSFDSKRSFREESRGQFDEESESGYGKRQFSKKSDAFEYGKSMKPQKRPDYSKEKLFKDIDPKKRKKYLDQEKASDSLIRLNRYIANAGLCSRREADELIESGQITVNGKVITEMGYKVQPIDVVKYGRKILNSEKLVYILLNKPKDYITTTDDPDGRKTVMELVKKAGPERIYPVGRLDRATTGLLLFTNDGELAEKLTHPSHEIKKIYQAEIDKPITGEDFEKLMNGLELEDGFIKPDKVSIVTPDQQVIGLEIHSGRNRVVRRMFESLGYEVTQLDRTTYAGLTKKNLARGNWRYLTEKEVIRLKYSI